jgi:hypothetical protein
MVVVALLPVLFFTLWFTLVSPPSTTTTPTALSSPSPLGTTTSVLPHPTLTASQRKAAADTQTALAHHQTTPAAFAAMFNHLAAHLPGAPLRVVTPLTTVGSQATVSVASAHGATICLQVLGVKAPLALVRVVPCK